MPRKLINLSIGLVIAALVAALGYWNVSPTSTENAIAGNSQQTIDFFIEGATSTQFQEDGQLSYILTAEKLEHIKQTDITLVSAPKLDLFRGTDLPWKVTSLSAEVSPDGEEVELIGDVRIARMDAKGRPTIITSSRMTVIPDKEYAQTEQAVRIVAANGVTTAQGMKAYLKDSRINLLSNVRGQHEAR